MCFRRIYEGKSVKKCHYFQGMCLKTALKSPHVHTFSTFILHISLNWKSFQYDQTCDNLEKLIERSIVCGKISRRWSGWFQVKQLLQESLSLPSLRQVQKKTNNDKKVLKVLLILLLLHISLRFSSKLLCELQALCCPSARSSSAPTWHKRSEGFRQNSHFHRPSDGPVSYLPCPQTPRT